MPSCFVASLSIMDRKSSTGKRGLDGVKMVWLVMSLLDVEGLSIVPITSLKTIIEIMVFHRSEI